MPFNALKHLVYFELLAETDETSAEWHSITGGLVVLRALDTWADLGNATITENRRGIANVRVAVGQIQSAELRASLIALLDSVIAARHPDMTEIRARLRDYADVLMKDRNWRLAIDAYTTIIGYSDEETDSGSIMHGQMQLGYCLRMLGSYEDAAQAYAEAGQIAAALGDQEQMLRIRLADAQLELDRGNYVLAKALVGDCVAQASGQEALAGILEAALETESAIASLETK